MTDITPKTLVKRDPDMISADMDGETVMMSIEHGEYFGLSGIGPFLWDSMEEAISIDDLCRKVLATYEVDAETCQSDVLELVADLKDKGIVRIIETD